jgi:hypothetical protein
MRRRSLARSSRAARLSRRMLQTRSRLMCRRVQRGGMPLPFLLCSQPRQHRAGRAISWTRSQSLSARSGVRSVLLAQLTRRLHRAAGSPDADSRSCTPPSLCAAGDYGRHQDTGQREKMTALTRWAGEPVCVVGTSGANISFTSLDERSSADARAAGGPCYCRCCTRRAAPSLRVCRSCHGHCLALQDTFNRLSSSSKP